MLLINKPVNLQNKTKGGITSVLKRVFFQGFSLAREGVKIGQPFVVRDLEDGMRLEFVEDNGDRIVSRRKTGGKECPLIEVNESNSKWLSSIADDSVLRIAVTDKGITIKLNQETVAERVREREERVLNKVKNGEKLEKGSVFAGGGTFDKAGHKGFAKSGLSTVVRIAIDFAHGAVENLAKNCGELFDERSLLVESDIALLNMFGDLPKLDMAIVTPPCVDACKAGKAKKGNIEETLETAHLVHYYSNFIDRTNPAYVIMENVSEFMNEASFKVIKSLLKYWGYRVQTRVIQANEEGFSLEARKRMFLVAVSEGLADSFDINDVVPVSTMPNQLSEALEEYADNDEAWKPKTGLLEKMKRDQEKGNGFMMQVFNGSESFFATIRKGYQKSGSADPLIKHPYLDLFRIVNKDEHARIKGQDPELVAGLSQAEGHRLLGNGVVGTVAESICYWLGKSIMSLSYRNEQHALMAA